MRQTRGSETSQYPEEKTSSEIPSVAASERGEAQTDPSTKRTTLVQGEVKKETLFLACAFTFACFLCVGVGVVGPRK